MPNEWDVPLFDVPEKYRPPKRQQVWPIYRRYKGKRISCDGCILEIASGRRTALSEFATYSRADADGTRYYCDRHIQERKYYDSRGER